MPDPLGTAAITKLVGKVLDELYESGKELFSSQLARLKNDAVRKKLVKRAAASELVKTIWQLDKPVRIPDFYYPSRIRFNPEIEKEVSSLKHFPRKGNIVIQGTIGQGKSIFLRYICAQELRGKGTERIPVFVELRSVEPTGGLRAALLRTLDEYGFDINEDLWHFYSTSGKFVLLLDAFDELLPECVPGVIEELDHLVSKYPDLQIIVTSRPDSDIQPNRNFRTFRIAPLRPQDHKPFLKKLLVQDRDVKNLLEAIEASPARVALLLTTPLMLTLVAVVYRAEQAIPPELPAFFEMLFTTLFSRHDRTKSGFIRKRYSSLTERETQTLFEAFCFMTRHHRMSTSLTDQEFARALRDAIKYSGISCEDNAFFQDITKIACLMQREGLKTKFVHKSIQEFFAASFVRRANDDFAERYYETQRTGQSVWRQENAFLMQIDPYRYGKRLFLPEITAIESFCGVSFSAGTPVADERVLAVLVGKSELQVTVDEYADAEVLLNYPPDAGPLLRQLMSKTSWVCFTNIDGVDEDAQGEVLKHLEKLDEKRYRGSVLAFVKEANLMDQLKIDVDEEFEVLKRRFDYLSNIVALEESKSGLFEALPRPIRLN